MPNNLVIVDIQYMFSGYFDETYLQKVQVLVEQQQWDTLVVVYNEKEYREEEDILEYVPPWLAKAATHVVRKYVSLHLYENYLSDLMKSGFKEETPNTAWRKEDILLIRTPSVHDLFFVPKSLQDVSMSMQDCLLIGGGIDYCLADIKASLDYLGVKAQINHTYTYALDNWEEKMDAMVWVATNEHSTT